MRVTLLQKVGNLYFFSERQDGLEKKEYDPKKK